MKDKEEKILDILENFIIFMNFGENFLIYVSNKKIEVSFLISYENSHVNNEFEIFF